MYPAPRSPWVTLAAAWLALGSTVALADALDGVLQVRSAFVDLDHSVFQLHARIDYPMSPAISEALRDGVDLLFEVDARVERARRFWFDSTVVDVTLRRELAYHTVADRYVVRDPDDRRSADLRHARRRAAVSGHRGWLADTGRATAGDRRAVRDQRARRHSSRASVLLAARAAVLDR